MTRTPLALGFLLAACGDPAGGVDAADPPPVIDADPGVSLARDLQPLFTARCATRFCHDHATQTAVLDLSSPETAHQALVDVRSQTASCNAFVRVRPGLPDDSYLMWKLAGAGACLYGVRMPKDAAPLAAADVNLVRAWIAEGARLN